MTYFIICYNNAILVTLYDLCSKHLGKAMQFKANNNLEEALEYSKNNKLTAIIEKYGDSNAPWLFMLDYSKGIPRLLQLMDDLASIDDKDVQTFKA